MLTSILVIVSENNLYFNKNMTSLLRIAYLAEIIFNANLGIHLARSRGEHW